MTDKTKLREAIEAIEYLCDGAGPAYPPALILDTDDQLVIIKEAAQTLLDLYEHHNIQSLIDGKAYVAPLVMPNYGYDTCHLCGAKRRRNHAASTGDQKFTCPGPPNYCIERNATTKGETDHE